MLDVHRSEYQAARVGNEVPIGPWPKGLLTCFCAVFAPAQGAPERTKRVEIRVVHALLERDDRVVRYVDMLRADLLAALGDVAVAGSGGPLQQRPPVEDVARMHFQAGNANHVARSVVLLHAVVVAQHVAPVLAEEALDALPELVHSLDVHLPHPPWLARMQDAADGRRASARVPE